MSKKGDYALAAEWLEEVEKKFGREAAIKSGTIIGLIRSAIDNSDPDTRSAVVFVLQRMFENAKSACAMEDRQ
jgi:hypothetical protein